MMLLLRRALVLLVLLAAALALWLWLAPPALIRVGAAYAAKIVCSSVFVSGRDADTVLALDVQAPLHPLLKLMRVEVDREARTVRAGLLGFAGQAVAVARPGTGCASVPDGDLTQARQHTAPPPPAGPDAAPRPALWPDGDRVADANPVVAALLDDAALAGPGARALLVVHRGRIVAERYGVGIGPGTPLLGWSMAKTVTAALVGTLVRDGRLDPVRTNLRPDWAGDGRRDIALGHLLSMSSGLSFNEDYGAVTDVTRMLFFEPDMAAFAAAQPLVQPVGLHFSYASGSTVLLSRLWQAAAPAPALARPRQALFDPLGMRSAVMEADARGTLVGSSYMYATGQDWARFAQLLLQGGQWRGQALLPPGWVNRMLAPSSAAPAEYTQGLLWRRGPQPGAPDGQAPEASDNLPPDTVWMRGHDGQAIAVVPSRQLAVIRLGLTPASLGHRPQRLVQAVLKALP